MEEMEDGRRLDAIKHSFWKSRDHSDVVLLQVVYKFTYQRACPASLVRTHQPKQ